MGKLARTCGLLLFAGMALSACEDLPKLPSDVCGNGVIEAGEDCDGVGIGQNTCNALCRLECTAERACPTGFGCGSDGLCRQPTGTFEPFGPALGLSAERLTLADFDGDGQNDLLASRASSLSVAYVGPQGLLPETTTLAHTPIDVYSDVPAVLDIDGDGRADLASRLGPSIGVLRGQQDRTLLPLPFAWQIPELLPEDVVFLAETDRITSPGPEVYAVRPDGIYLLFARKEGIALPMKILSYDHQGKRPHVTPVRISSNAIGKSAGATLALAWDGDTKIKVYAPFAVLTDPMTNDITVEPNVDDVFDASVEVALPLAAKVKGAVIGGRLEPSSNYFGDDLVIPVSHGGQDKLFATFSTAFGLGSIPSNFSSQADYTARELRRFVGTKEVHDLPLAAGYFGSRELLDFVDPNGIHVAGCRIEPTVACPMAFDVNVPAIETPVIWAMGTAAGPESATGWTGAVLFSTSDAEADLSGSKFAEVAVTTNEPGFTFFKRAVGDALNPFRIQTQSPVQHPNVGDFNGDGALDLVFSQISTRATAQDPDLESVHVAFGDPYGIPRGLSDLGDVGKVDSIFSARIIDAFTSSNVSGLSDALVRAKKGSSAEYYLFAGSTDGTLQSALDLTVQCGGAVSPHGTPRFLSLSRGPLGKGARLVALYRNNPGMGGTYEYRLWSANLATTGSADVCKSLVGPASVSAEAGVDVAMEAVDLDGDGADETLILPKGKGTTLFIAKEQATDWKVTPVDLGAPANGLSLVNLGRTSTSGAPLTDVAVLTPEGVTLLWNDGTGSLDAAKATKIAISGIEYTTKKGGTWKATRPLGVTAVGSGADGKRALTIVTAEDTFLVELTDAKTRKFAEPARRSLAFGGGGDAVTAGDIDGDGVDDLVIARPGGIQIWSGVPVVK